MTSATTSKNTRTQFRGTCSICGKEHAVTDGRNMAHHGYTVTWNTFMNACGGSQAPHYGHKDAPAHIMSVVSNLEAYLVQLPELIESAKIDLANTPKGTDWQSRNNYRNAGLRVSNLVFSLEKGIPESIVEFTARAKNWVAMDLIEVDLLVEEQQAKDKRAAEKAEKEAAKAAKKAATEERKRKANENAKKKWDALYPVENFHRLWYKGELVLEWTAAYDDERSYYDDHNAKKRAHLTKVGVTEHHEQHWAFMSGDVWSETRNQPDGKGRRLNSTKI